ncbi:unnamed protein product [Caenorhabditis brenneri]
MMVLETRPAEFYQIDNAFYLKLYNAVDGLVSHLIPCIVFPFITFLLVKELWKADENRKRLFSSSKAKDSKRTTRLVYYFTLTFFLAEFPCGICTSIAQLFYKSSGIMFILQFFGHLFSMLITANTSTHFIVCMLMSSQYREAAKSVACCGRHVEKVDASVCDLCCILFPSALHSKPTQMDGSYCGVDDFPGYTSILINLLHFSILVKRSMRSSSINLLMAAVAVCDIFSQFNGVFWNVKNYLEAQESCKTDVYWYSITLAENKFLWLQDSMRRYSTWLSFSIAFIRTLVVRYPMSTSFEKLSKPKSSFYFIFAVVLMNLPLNFFGFMEYTESYVGDNFIEDGECQDYAIYFSQSSEWFMDNEGRVSKIFNSLDGIFSKVRAATYFLAFSIQIIPCILYPLVTVILIIELRKASIARKRLSSTAESNASGKTTKLILYLTVTFFIAEFPVGIIYTMNAYYSFQSIPIETAFLYHFYVIFMLLLSVNTCSHLVICLLMSSQYKETAKGIFSGCGVKKTKSEAFGSLGPVQSTYRSSAILSPVE